MKDIIIEKIKHKKLLSYITNRFWIKALCLTMSFMLFLYVRYQQEYNKEYTTKLNIKNLPAKLLIANNIKETVTVSVKGFKDNIYELPRDFSAYIDLTNAQIGSNMYKVYLEDDADYSSLNINITPNKIPVVLDQLAYKTVPIEVQTVGKASLGLEIENIIINPSNTIISGPKTLISQIDKLYTRTIDLDDKYLDYNTKLTLNIPPNVKSDTFRVDASIIFNKDIEIVTFENIELNINNLNSRFNIKYSEPLIVKKIVLEMNKNLIENLKKEDILLSLNLINITNEGIYSNISIEANIPFRYRSRKNMDKSIIKNIKFGDIIIILIIVISIIYYAKNLIENKGSKIIIDTPSKSLRYDLNTDREIKAEGLIGETTIIIKDKKIKFEHSPCRDKLCIKAGELKNAPIICMPNGVLIRFEKNTENDITIDSVVQ